MLVAGVHPGALRQRQARSSAHAAIAGNRPPRHMRRVLSELSGLRFASDATYAAIGGGALLLVALVALWAETRRVKRTQIDAVGWVPWTRVFFFSLLLGIALLMMAVKGWHG
jgi:hypothetical protein